MPSTTPKRIIVWFRKDLRLHDNEALIKALEDADEVYPVYVFKNGDLKENTPFNLKKTGPFRLNFLLESVRALKTSFRKIGSDLIVREGDPDEAIFELAKSIEATAVYANMERTLDEVKTQDALEKNLWTKGVELSFFRGKMLYYTQDLPFPISHAPDTFSAFRKEVDRFVKIRAPFDTPVSLPSWSADVTLGQLPKITDFGAKKPRKDKRSSQVFKGGEAAALERLEYFCSDQGFPRQFEKCRYELQGPDNSSRLSPWLALGCLSPKTVFFKVKDFEQEYGASKSSAAFVQELLWRDHYRLIGKKHCDKIFSEGGILGRETKPLQENAELLQQWIDGKTDCSLINACMNELSQTGFLSHRGRQLVSSFLVNDMGVSWRMGAAYFQHILIDYDICSNWVNWNIAGGVGPDTKDDRYINVYNQEKKLDPNALYTNLWVRGKQTNNSG
jgi:deoxyribodipyrimidine photo-lyase